MPTLLGTPVQYTLLKCFLLLINVSTVDDISKFAVFKCFTL